MHRPLLIRRIKEGGVQSLERHHREYSASIVVVASLRLGGLVLVRTDTLRRTGLKAIRPLMDILTDLHRVSIFAYYITLCLLDV